MSELYRFIKALWPVIIIIALTLAATKSHAQLFNGAWCSTTATDQGVYTAAHCLTDDYDKDVVRVSERTGSLPVCVEPVEIGDSVLLVGEPGFLSTLNGFTHTQTGAVLDVGEETIAVSGHVYPGESGGSAILLKRMCVVGVIVRQNVRSPVVIIEVIHDE